MIENLKTAIHPDTIAREAPELPKYEANRGNSSTDDVDFWTSKATYPIKNSQVNCVVANTRQWEQTTVYIVDTHPITQD